MAFNIILTIILSITSAFSAEEIKRGLKTLETINKNTQLCEGKDECSPVIKNLIGVDKKDEFFGLLKNQYDICARYIERDKNYRIFKTPYELSQNLAQYQVKNSISADADVIDSCLSSDTVRSKEAVSKYYYYVNRLQVGQSSDLEEIADIDRLLNKTGVLQDVDCKSIPFEGNKKRCHDLKAQCKPGSGLDDLARDAEADLKLIDSINADIGKIKKELYAQRAKGKIPNLKEKIELIHAKKLLVELVMSSNPILKGETFQKEKKSNVREAVKRQLEANRKELVSHLVETNLTHKCLSGTIITRSCDANKVRDFIEKKTPRIVQSFDVLKGKTRDESISGSDYLTFQMCLHDAKVDQLKTEDELDGAFLNAGIGLATVGVGSAFSLGKAVQSARQLQITKVAQGFVKGVDGTYFATAIADAGKECLSQTNELEGELKSEGSSCQTNSSFSTRQAVRAHDNCLMNIVTAGLSGVPLAAGAIQKVAQNSNLSKTEQLLLKAGMTKESQQKVVMANAALDDVARAKKIGEDFKNLSKEQIDCIVNKAHTIGKGKGVYQYSQAEIMKKGRTLRRTCKVDVDEMKALLQLGYAGDVPPAAVAKDLEKLLDSEVDYLAAAKEANQRASSLGAEASSVLSKGTVTPSDLVKVKSYQDELKYAAKEYQNAALVSKNPSTLSKSWMASLKAGDTDGAYQTALKGMKDLNMSREGILRSLNENFQARTLKLKNSPDDPLIQMELKSIKSLMDRLTKEAPAAPAPKPVVAEVKPPIPAPAPVATPKVTPKPTPAPVPPRTPQSVSPREAGFIGHELRLKKSHDEASEYFVRAAQKRSLDDRYFSDAVDSSFKGEGKVLMDIVRDGQKNPKLLNEFIVKVFDEQLQFSKNPTIKENVRKIVKELRSNGEVRNQLGMPQIRMLDNLDRQ